MSEKDKQDNSQELTILLELYKAAVEEYRFQVNLNWDRSKFYLVLNSGLITATCGLLRIPGFKFAEFLTLPLFILGFLASWLGYSSLLKGIEYRRRVIYQKGQIENKLTEYLDLDQDIIPINTTQGMREAKESDFNEFINRPPRIGTINYFLALLFILLTAVNGIALGFITVLLVLKVKNF